MTREEMWEEFENQLKREVHTPITMSYDDSIRLAELGIKETVARWKERLEQEPKQVIYSGDGYADGYMVYDMAECPNCGYEYEDGDKDWGENFCPHCGQPLEWESEG